MNPINLLDYSDAQQKIPFSVMHASLITEKVKTWKMLFAYYLDFSAVLVATMLVNILCVKSLTALMITNRLAKVFLPENTAFAPTLFPIMLLGYFFFSYFLNHGQSWGQHMMKHRICMKEQDFRSSFNASIISAAVCLSGGILLPWTRLKQSIFTHDYLYQSLITIKDEKAPKLCMIIKEESTDSTKIAA